MKIFFASDHAGFQMKEALVPYVRDELGFEVEDCGASAHEPEDDYPDFVSIAAKKISEDDDAFGIILGGSGQGEAVVANRMKGIRAVVYYGAPAKTQIDATGSELDMIASTRAHNDANVLSLGARFVSFEEAKEVVKLWLETPFSGDERHVRRIAKIDTVKNS